MSFFDKVRKRQIIHQKTVAPREFNTTLILVPSSDAVSNTWIKNCISTSVEGGKKNRPTNKNTRRNCKTFVCDIAHLSRQDRPMNFCCYGSLVTPSCRQCTAPKPLWSLVLHKHWIDVDDSFRTSCMKSGSRRDELVPSRCVPCGEWS